MLVTQAPCWLAAVVEEAFSPLDELVQDSRLKLLARAMGQESSHRVKIDALHREFSRDAARACAGATCAEREALNLLPALVWKIVLLENIPRFQPGQAVLETGTTALRHAIATALRLVRPGVALKDRMREKSDWTGVGAEALIDLVARVRVRGRCNTREILRSYHSRKIEHLRPQLEEAVRWRLILEDGGFYSLPSTPSGEAGRA